MRGRIRTSFGLRASFGERCEACDYGHVVGSMLRLVFHDAVGGPGGAADGPNGCVDLTSPLNFGLEKAVERYDEIRATVLADNMTLSRADLWVLGAAEMLVWATTVSEQADSSTELESPEESLRIPVWYGRRDVLTCNDTGFVPPLKTRWAQMQVLFGELSTASLVALMGGHSLGRTGDRKSWSDAASSFSNRYYINLVGLPWFNAHSPQVPSSALQAS